MKKPKKLTSPKAANTAKRERLETAVAVLENDTFMLGHLVLGQLAALGVTHKWLNDPEAKPSEEDKKLFSDISRASIISAAKLPSLRALIVDTGDEQSALSAAIGKSVDTLRTILAQFDQMQAEQAAR